MHVRATGVTKTAYSLLEFGFIYARAAGAERCSKLSGEGLTLVTVDASCTSGAALLAWHNETSRGFDCEDAAAEVQRVIQIHKDQVAKGTDDRERPLVTFWAPHDIVQAYTGNKKLRAGEVWAAAVADRKVTRAPVNYFS